MLPIPDDSCDSLQYAAAHPIDCEISSQYEEHSFPPPLFLVHVCTKDQNCEVKRFLMGPPLVLEAARNCFGNGSVWRCQLKARQTSAHHSMLAYHHLVVESFPQSKLCQKHPAFSWWRTCEGSWMARFQAEENPDPVQSHNMQNALNPLDCGGGHEWMGALLQSLDHHDTHQWKQQWWKLQQSCSRGWKRRCSFISTTSWGRRRSWDLRGNNSQ